MVHDVPAAEAFYAKVLGLVVLERVVHGGEHPLEETVMAVPGAENGPRLIVARPFGRPLPPPGESITGFMVTDIHASVGAVVEAGGSIIHPPLDNEEHGLRLAFVTDHEGHVIELLQIIER
jgi:predicted enzyme related to lactoylglutathione lyase